MLRVKVEVVPFGIESLTKALTTVVVANDGTGPHDEAGHMTHGNYDVYTEDDRTGRQHIGRIEGFERTGPDRRRDALAAAALELVSVEVTDSAA